MKFSVWFFLVVFCFSFCGCVRVVHHIPTYYKVVFDSKVGNIYHLQVEPVTDGFCSRGKDLSGRRVYSSSCYSSKYKSWIYLKERDILKGARQMVQKLCEGLPYRIEASVEMDTLPELECNSPSCFNRKKRKRGRYAKPPLTRLAYECDFQAFDSPTGKSSVEDVEGFKGLEKKDHSDPKKIEKRREAEIKERSGKRVEEKVEKKVEETKEEKTEEKVEKTKEEKTEEKPEKKTEETKEVETEEKKGDQQTTEDAAAQKAAQETKKEENSSQSTHKDGVNGVVVPSNQVAAPRTDIAVKTENKTPQKRFGDMPVNLKKDVELPVVKDSGVKKEKAQDQAPSTDAAPSADAVKKEASPEESK